MALTDSFERVNPGAGVAIKRGTPDVPNDGGFHLLVNGEIVKSFRSRAAANDAFKDAVAKSGWVPEPKSDEKIDFSKMATDKFFDDYDAYWSRSSAFTPKGGKGR